MLPPISFPTNPALAWCRRIGAALALLAALTTLCRGALAATTSTAEYTEVTRLLHAGQGAEALARADRYIAANPRDPQMQFIKAVVLSETGHPDQAEPILLKLTRDYPELAEPYNNLAVLYAARGELGLAREALDNALRINPKYATARENLGDVYARLARQAWQQAREADKTNDRLAPKIEAIDKLLAPADKPAGR